MESARQRGEAKASARRLKRGSHRADRMGMSQIGVDVVEDLQLLDVKLKQLRNEYEQYFLGSRRREPILLRGEVQKIVAYYANVPIRNTGYRFKFNNLRARFFALRRHWDRILREIEEGRYERHLFRARIHERELSEEADSPRPPGGSEEAEPEDIFARYLAAREACGQSTAGLTRQKLDALMEKQAAEIAAKLGCHEVRFRVVVEDGRAKLKVSPLRSQQAR